MNVIQLVSMDSWNFQPKQDLTFVIIIIIFRNVNELQFNSLKKAIMIMGHICRAHICLATDSPLYIRSFDVNSYLNLLFDHAESSIWSCWNILFYFLLCTYCCCFCSFLHLHHLIHPRVAKRQDQFDCELVGEWICLWCNSELWFFRCSGSATFSRTPPVYWCYWYFEGYFWPVLAFPYTLYANEAMGTGLVSVLIIFSIAYFFIPLAFGETAPVPVLCNLLVAAF